MSPEIRHFFNVCYEIVSICSGFSNKILGPGWLSWKCVFSQFRRLEVQDQGVSRSVSSEASPLGLQMAIFSLCLHMAIPLLWVCV